MKTIKLYSNEADGIHDTAAVYQMLFEYFLGKKTSKHEIEEFIGQEEDSIPSTIQPLTLMARQGFDIRTVSQFDYAAFADRGEAYLKQAYNIAHYEHQVSHTNILRMDLLMPEFMRSVRLEKHAPTLNDLDSMLKEGRLVYLTLNSEVLLKEGGKQHHAVLVLQREADDFIIHDPGLPARHYERISRNLMARAISHEDAYYEMSGFLFRKSHIAHRLDQYVVTKFPRISRSFAAKLIEEGKVLVSGKIVKPGYKVRATDVVTIDYDDSALDLVPSIDLPILYEDENCIVINKPAGILTHAQSKHVNEATVATFLRDRLSDTAGLSGERAGIVHRLDRATSGVIICAKTAPALTWLQQQFAERTAHKTYMAVVKGTPAQLEAIIDMPIERNPKAPATFRVGVNGKHAVTHYEVIEQSATHSLIRLEPQTGRTHQLRVHLEKLGHPIVGDPLYGDAAYGDRLYLHAEKLAITLPNGQEKTFTAPLPDEFRAIMSA